MKTRKGKVIYKRRPHFMNIKDIWRMIVDISVDPGYYQIVDRVFLGKAARILMRWVDDLNKLMAQKITQGSKYGDWRDAYLQFILFFDDIMAVLPSTLDVADRALPGIQEFTGPVREAAGLYALVRKTFPID